MIEFLNNPVIEYLGGDNHILREDFWLKHFDFTICIPEGFHTDFATVPRIPVAYLLFAGKAKKSAIYHDFIYGTHPEGFTRKMADDAFLCGMEAEGLDWFSRQAMYAGVRVGGGRYWNPN